MAVVKCSTYIVILLLGLSTCGNGSFLQNHNRHGRSGSSATKNTTSSEGCRLKNKTFSTGTVNWTRLIRLIRESRIPQLTISSYEVISFDDTNVTTSNITISSIHNTTFPISYCSGRCLRHNMKTKGHVIKDIYALQMRNLVKSCDDDNMNCEELTPCCVPKRYDGKKIEFDKRSITVQYRDVDDKYRGNFTYTYLNPRVCHCQ